MKERSPITTHVLDLHRGKPAAGISVTLKKQEGPGQWRSIGRAETNDDGRVENLLEPGAKMSGGLYRLVFATGEYFATLKTRTFFPTVTITFEITSPKEHHHVPLLLNANGYSTYRGS